MNYLGNIKEEYCMVGLLPRQLEEQVNFYQQMKEKHRSHGSLSKELFTEF